MIPCPLACCVVSIPQRPSQRQFYARLARQSAEREQAAAEAGRKKYVTLLPSESLSGDPPKRDWSRIVDQHGHLRHLS
jgi:hypothetical protein